MTDSTDLEVRSHVASGARPRDPQALDLLTLPLEELGRMAKSELEQAEAHVGRAMTHALRCGEILLMAREQLAYGEWVPWLDSIRFDRNSASKFIRLAYYRHELPDVNVMTQKDALDALSGKPPVFTKGGIPIEVKNLAMEMLASGASPRTVAEETGVRLATVNVWHDPNGVVERRKARDRARREKKRMEREAAAALDRSRRVAEAAAAAKSQGQAVSKLYASIRQSLAALDVCIAASDNASRGHFEEVGRALRRAEYRMEAALSAHRGRAE